MSILLFLHVGYACSGLHPVPVVVDSTNYIVIGQVIGYERVFNESDLLTSEFVNRKLVGGDLDHVINGSASGLRIELSQNIFSPQSIDTLDIYMFGYTPSCTPSGRDEKYLIEHYPIGTNVRVVGKQSEYFTSHSDDGVKRVDVWRFNLGLCDINIASDTHFEFCDEIQNYSDFSALNKAKEEYQVTRKNRLLGDAIREYDKLQRYHIYLDLLRIKRAKSFDEIQDILGRLLLYARLNSYHLRWIIYGNITNEIWADQLYLWVLEEYMG